MEQPECLPGQEQAQLSASAKRRLRRERAALRESGGQSIAELQQSIFAEDVTCLSGRVWSLSRDPVGCRLVQEALELGNKDAAALAQELRGHVLEAAMCSHANYVLQKAISHLSVASSSFVAAELEAHAFKAAKHPFACRILCRLLEFSTAAVTSQLMDELLRDAPALCTHPFAHHVLESILENGEERHRDFVAEVLLSNAWKHATHKNASYLVERLLFLPKHRQRVIAELGHPETLFQLAQTQYGCYVAHALLRDGHVKAAMLLAFSPEKSSGPRLLAMGLAMPSPRY